MPIVFTFVLLPSDAILKRNALCWLTIAALELWFPAVTKTRSWDSAGREHTDALALRLELCRRRVR